MSKKGSWSAPLWLSKILGNKIDTRATALETKLDNTVTYIENLFTSSADVDGSPADLLLGKTLFNGTSVVTGTMPNNGAVEATVDAGGTYIIPLGYHNGSGSVSTGSLENLTEGTAVASNILSGKTAYVNGVKVTGSMADKSATTQTASVSQDSSYTYLTVPSSGYYSTSSKLRTSNNNLAGLTLVSILGDRVTGKATSSQTYTTNAYGTYYISIYLSTERGMSTSTSNITISCSSGSVSLVNEHQDCNGGTYNQKCLVKVYKGTLSSGITITMTGKSGSSDIYFTLGHTIFRS